MLKKIKTNGVKSIISFGVIFSSFIFASSANAQAFDSFVKRIESTGTGVGSIVAVIAYTLAGIMFLIAGWNMYKKSKNPNGNEGAIILGAVIAGSVLIAIPTVAGIGQDGLFGSDDTTELNFNKGT